MTKTELRKLRTKKALNVLVEQFNAYSISNDDGARFDFFVDFEGETFHGQLDRRDLQISFYDSIRLHGDGFAAEEIKHQALAVNLEDFINEELEEAMDELEEKIYKYEVDEAMGFRPDPLV